MDRSKWEYKKLGEVCEILDKLRKPVTKSDRVAGQYPYYGATGIQDYVANYIFDGRYLLLGEDGAKWGANDRSAFIIEGKTWVNNHAHILKINSDYMDVFVMYYLNHKDLSEYITGAVVPKLTQAAMAKIPVPYINIADQQRIVAELDCLNEMIALKQEQLNEFDKLAQSIFYDMFGDPVSNEKGWIEKIMGDVCSFSQGVQVDLEKQTLNPKDGFERFIRISDFTTTDCELRYVKDVDRKYHIDIDDIAIVRYGASAGFVCWGLKGILANNLFKLNHDKAILNTRFLVQQLSTNYYRSFIKAEAFGAAMPALSFKSLKHFKLILPPLALQQQFAEKIQAIEAQKELVKQSIAETQHLLDSRMDYYFD